MSRCLKIFLVGVLLLSSLASRSDDLYPLEITDVLYSDGIISGSLCWRGTESLTNRVILDVFATTPTPTNQWRWVRSILLEGPTDGRTWYVRDDELGVTNSIGSIFVKIKERSTSSASLDDMDGDTIPDLYEYENGSNPYLYDYSDIPKLTVGSSGQYSTLSAAISASRPYSIIALPEDERLLIGSVSLPSHPIMIVGGTNGYAYVRSSGSPYAFELKRDQDHRTIFQNIYLELLPSSGVQTGFYCGKGVFVQTSREPSSSATFRNVYIRAAGSSTSGEGWSIRGSKESKVTIERCVVNADGSADFIGVSAINPPPMSITNCTFINFPPDTGRRYGAAIQIEGIELTSQTTTTVTRCLFDESFTNAYPLARLGSGVVVRSEANVLPEGYVNEYPPDIELGSVVSTNFVMRFGHPVPGGLADELGIGALVAVGQDSTLDSDRDGACDWEEIYLWNTNPFDEDSDDDSVKDGDEIAGGSDPNDANVRCCNFMVNHEIPLLTNKVVHYLIDCEIPIRGVLTPNDSSNFLAHVIVRGDLPRLIVSNDVYSIEVPYVIQGHDVIFGQNDSDQDGMDDMWELSAGLNPADGTDAYSHDDHDGMVNLHEYWSGTNPYEDDGEDTALYALAHSIDDRLSEIGPTGRLRFYSSVGQTSIVKNTNCWARAISLECQSPYNDTEGTYRSGTLVSDRHVIFANHYTINEGDNLYFGRGDGVVITNQLMASVRVGSTDIRVGVLSDSMAGTGITPAFVLPDDYVEYIGTGKGLPAIIMTQNDDCHVADLNSLSSVTRSELSNRRDFCNLMWSGISGDPVFLVAGNSPIMLFEILTYNTGSIKNGFWGVSGPSIVSYKSEIQQAMDGLSDTYGYPKDNLREFDFTQYRRIRNE